MSYDMRVYKLVELFLSEVPEKNTAKNRHLLAQHIQDEIEDWILSCCCRICSVRT